MVEDHRLDSATGVRLFRLKFNQLPTEIFVHHATLMITNDAVGQITQDFNFAGVSFDFSQIKFPIKKDF